MNHAVHCTLFAVAILVSGCASTPRSHDMTPEASAALREARVLIVPSSPSSGRRTDPTEPVLASVVTPSVTSAIAGGVVANVVLNAIVFSDARADRNESRALLLKNGRIPDEDFARSVLEQELAKLAASKPPVEITSIASSEEGIESAPPRAGNASPTVNISVGQSMSVDLSRLRMRFHAIVSGTDGAQLMQQNIYYLPVSVAGASKEASLKQWADADYRLYREHVQHGVRGAVEALDAIFFSRTRFDLASAADAQSMLQRTNCYGGDYDAGIPMSAYRAGRLLPTRSGVTAIRLDNGDILLFPKCES